MNRLRFCPQPKNTALLRHALRFAQEHGVSLSAGLFGSLDKTSEEEEESQSQS